MIKTCDNFRKFKLQNLSVRL